MDANTAGWTRFLIFFFPRGSTFVIRERAAECYVGRDLISGGKVSTFHIKSHHRPFKELYFDILIIIYMYIIILKYYILLCNSLYLFFKKKLITLLYF